MNHCCQFSVTLLLLLPLLAACAGHVDPELVSMPITSPENSPAPISIIVPTTTATSRPTSTTSTTPLATAALPYLVEIAEGGLENALVRDPGLARGVVLYRGMHVHPRIAATVGAEPRPLSSLLEDRS